MTEAADSFAAVRHLLAEAVDSFEKLEVLVHLCDAQREMQEVRTIARAVSLSTDAVLEALSELLRDGLVATIDQNVWSFDRNGPRAATVEALAKLYVDDRIRMLTVMTELALERVRLNTAQRLTDAFVDRLKKTDGEDNS